MRFENTMFDHVVKLFFESLSMHVSFRISTVVHRLSTIFEVNVNLLMRIDSKGSLAAGQAKGGVDQKATLWMLSCSYFASRMCVANDVFKFGLN